MSIKSVLASIAAAFLSGMKKTAIELIVKAELSLPGATGKEKRAFVVEKLDDLIRLPWYLEAIDGPALGVLVDVLCDKLNLLTDHEKALIAGEEEKAAMAVEATDKELSNPDLTVEEKLESLYKKYNV